MNGPMRLRQGGRSHAFPQNMCICFVEKNKYVPCCRRRIRLPSGETSGLDLHRV